MCINLFQCQLEESADEQLSEKERVIPEKQIVKKSGSGSDVERGESLNSCYYTGDLE